MNGSQSETPTFEPTTLRAADANEITVLSDIAAGKISGPPQVYGGTQCEIATLRRRHFDAL
jgi:hypothetical protein